MRLRATDFRQISQYLVFTIKFLAISVKRVPNSESAERYNPVKFELFSSNNRKFTEIGDLQEVAIQIITVHKHEETTEVFYFSV